jgi:hypothetical protein
MFNPKSLVDAYSLVRMQEECVLTTRRSSRSTWHSTLFHPSHSGWRANLLVGVAKENIFSTPTQLNVQGQPRPPPLPLTGPGPVGKDNFNQNQALVLIKKITQAQMDERWRKGLCYLCDSKWSRGHVCTAPKLFLITAMEDVDAALVQDTPHVDKDPGEFFLEEFPKISLNAITGTPSPTAMQIVGFLKLYPVVILIDSGSTHNFVDTKLVATLGMHPMGHDKIKVQIANEQEIVSPGRSREVELRMQGYAFKTDLFIVLLAGCDAVLGIDWLRTLGPILCDFNKL